MVKNKVAPPFREAYFTLLHGQGISREADLIDTAIAANLVSKNGSTYSYKEEKLAVGYENSIAALKENKDLAKKMEAELRKLISNPPAQKEVSAKKEPAEVKKK